MLLGKFVCRIFEIQIRNREHKHELHENGLVMLGIKNMEYQYVSMLMHSIWWLGFMMFHCGLEMLQLVDVKDPYLRWWFSVDECLVEWVERTHQNLGPLAHSTFISFIMFGIVVLKHWLFWGTQIACNAYCSSWNAIGLCFPVIF
jgi:hypothetical protein